VSVHSIYQAFDRRADCWKDTPSYQNHEPQHAPSQVPMQSSAPAPSGLPQFRRASDHIAGPPISTYAQYHPPQFAQPQMPQYAGFSGPYADQGYQSPFQHPAQPQASHPQTSAHGQQSGSHFASVPSQPHHFVPLGSSSEQSAEEGDNSEGGVPLPPSY